MEALGALPSAGTCWPAFDRSFQSGGEPVELFATTGNGHLTGTRSDWAEALDSVCLDGDMFDTAMPSGDAVLSDNAFGHASAMPGRNTTSGSGHEAGGAQELGNMTFKQSATAVCSPDFDYDDDAMWSSAGISLGGGSNCTTTDGGTANSFMSGSHSSPNQTWRPISIGMTANSLPTSSGGGAGAAQTFRMDDDDEEL